LRFFFSFRVVREKIWGVLLGVVRIQPGRGHHPNLEGSRKSWLTLTSDSHIRQSHQTHIRHASDTSHTIMHHQTHQTHNSSFLIHTLNREKEKKIKNFQKSSNCSSWRENQKIFLLVPLSHRPASGTQKNFLCEQPPPLSTINLERTF